MKKYILVDREPIEATLEEWANFLEDRCSCVVDQTLLSRKIRVSTVFIGLEYGELFETMVFSPHQRQYIMTRSNSWLEAQEMHAKAIREVNKRIRFNPTKKTLLALEETLGPAMYITDKKEANKYLQDYIKYLCQTDTTLDKTRATEAAKSNLGYYAGYYSNDVRERVEELYQCEHPVFGSIKKNGPVDSKTAFKMGQALARSKNIKSIAIQDEVL